MKRLLPGKLLICLFAAGLMFTACKKIDMERVPYVVTKTPDPVFTTSVTANGIISDLGDGIVSEYGFCYDTIPQPTVEGRRFYYNGSPGSTGEFQIKIPGLSQGKKYYVRAYMETTQGRVYGSPVEFFTSGGSWYNYDNGINDDGIGYEGGGNFYAAIRFYDTDISIASGLKISKVKFYLRGDFTTSYQLKVWTIESGYTYEQYSQDINASNNSYAEYDLTTPYEIPTNVDGIYVGYFVEDPFGTYPAGVDAGPASPTDNGGMILLEGGPNWEYLVDIPIDANWNIQVYIVNSKGEEILLSNTKHLNKRTEINIKKNKTTITNPGKLTRKNIRFE